MTEKIGLIKNPLTIIAIFAGIAEVSGTIVLPFVAAENQKMFIWFLVLFPSLLVIIFFITLNFNNKVLYAPSDYKDESNYLVSNKYNAATQSNVIIKESVNEAFVSLSQKVDYINSESFLKEIKRQIASGWSTEQTEATPQVNVVENRSYYSYLIADELNRKEVFIRRMGELGYNVEIYSGHVSQDKPKPGIDNQAIWVGANVPLNLVKQVVQEAKSMYSFLKYIYINDSGNAPMQTFTEIFIGGSTKAAVSDLGLRGLKDKDFEYLNTINTWEEFKAFLEQFVND